MSVIFMSTLFYRQHIDITRRNLMLIILRVKRVNAIPSNSWSILDVFFFRFFYFLFFNTFFLFQYLFAWSNLRLVDIHDIQLRPEALELAMFQNVVMRHIEIAKETLLKKYVHSMRKLFSCLVFSHWFYKCVSPENIHSPPTERIGNSWGVGGSQRPNNLSKCMKLDWNFQRGGGWGV